MGVGRGFVVLFICVDGAGQVTATFTEVPAFAASKAVWKQPYFQTWGVTFDNVISFPLYV